MFSYQNKSISLFIKFNFVTIYNYKQTKFFLLLTFRDGVVGIDP